MREREWEKGSERQSKAKSRGKQCEASHGDGTDICTFLVHLVLVDFQCLTLFATLLQRFVKNDILFSQLIHSFPVSMSLWPGKTEAIMTFCLSLLVHGHTFSFSGPPFVCLCNIVRALFTWLLWSKCAHDILVFEVDYDTMQTFKRVL